MRIGDAQAAKARMLDWASDRYTYEEFPAVFALPGVTFASDGWLFALVEGGRAKIMRVGRRGGVTPLYSITRDQIEYLSPLVARR